MSVLHQPPSSRLPQPFPPPLPAHFAGSDFSPVLTEAEEGWVGGWRGGWGFVKLRCCLGNGPLMGNLMRVHSEFRFAA